MYEAECYEIDPDRNVIKCSRTSRDNVKEVRVVWWNAVLQDHPIPMQIGTNRMCIWNPKRVR